MCEYEKDSYFFSNFVYGENEERRAAVLKEAQEQQVTKAWEKWRCAILVETERSFFDTVRDTLPDEIQKGTRRQFAYYNLNSWQSLLLFSDEHCDYQLVAQQLYVFLKRRYIETLHLAVSGRLEGYEKLPEILWLLESCMEEKYYHPDVHVFSGDEEEYGHVNEEAQDSRLLEKISEDVSRKDLEGLHRHFGYLADKYRNSSKYSGMYVKFVFSSVIQELFWEREFARVQNIKEEMERLYSCSSMAQVLQVTEENIQKYSDFINDTMEETRRKVREAKEYIHQNCSQPLDMQQIASLVGMAPGYLSYIFRKETGKSIERFIRTSRMEKAKAILEEGASVEQVSEDTGFFNVNYFCKGYYDFYGVKL